MSKKNIKEHVATVIRNVCLLYCLLQYANVYYN